MKKISLLALLTVSLALPFSVNAVTNSTTVTPDANSDPYMTSFNSGLGSDTNSAATAFSLSDQGGTGSSFRNATGSGVINSFFYVAESTPFFSATLNSSLRSTAFTSTQLVDVTTKQAFNLAISNGQYNFGSLVMGDIYDFKAAYNIAAGSSASIYSTMTVASVGPIPEPEQWAMMIAGLFLVATKVGKAKKSVKTVSPLYA